MKALKMFSGKGQNTSTNPTKPAVRNQLWGPFALHQYIAYAAVIYDTQVVSQGSKEESIQCLPSIPYDGSVTPSSSNQADDIPSIFEFGIYKPPRYFIGQYDEKDHKRIAKKLLKSISQGSWKIVDLETNDICLLRFEGLDFSLDLHATLETPLIQPRMIDTILKKFNDRLIYLTKQHKMVTSPTDVAKTSSMIKDVDRVKLNKAIPFVLNLFKEVRNLLNYIDDEGCDDAIRANRLLFLNDWITRALILVDGLTLPRDKITNEPDPTWRKNRKSLIDLGQQLGARVCKIQNKSNNTDAAQH